MISIIEAKTARQRKEFIEFQNRLYRDVPEYIPTLYADEKANLNPKKNPAFEYCEMRFFLAKRGGKTVGRIGAIISKKANEVWGTKCLRITRMDFIDDNEVVDALLATVEQWGKSLGMEKVIGPIGFCDLDKEGMLVDGFSREGMFITYYNHPYYVQQMQRLGFAKEVDWTEHIVEVDGLEREKLDRVCNYILERGKFRVLTLKNKGQLKPYIPQIFALINSEYQKLYGVVPISEKQVLYYTAQFLTLINLNYLSLIEDEEGNLAAFALAAPSLAQAMKKCQGRLFPFGFLRVLRSIKSPKALDMYLIAVRSDCRNTGLACVLLGEVTRRAREQGIPYAETGPQLETNANIQKLFAYYKVQREVRRRRCWGKTL